MCSVVGCDSRPRSAQKFKLPEDPERRLEWVQFLLKANGQRLKESSWTDIAICSEHFTEDCFVSAAATGAVHLKSGAVPSLCHSSEPGEPQPVKPEPGEPEPGEPQPVKPEPGEPEPVKPEPGEPEPDELQPVKPEPGEPEPGEPQPVKPEPGEPEPNQKAEETTEVTSPYDQPETHESPSSESKESEVSSVAAQERPVPKKASAAVMSDYSQMLQKVANIDAIREKVKLLQMKRKYVVNENRLIQLFSCNCPFCGSKVKVEKVAQGVLLILNKQCLQCEYRNQWKSQVVDEESDPMDEEESSDEDDVNSDEDWHPTDEDLLAEELQSDDDSDKDRDNAVSSQSVKHSQLCTECGKFFVSEQKPHTCEHKIKPYSCNICGKRCVNEAALSSHSRVHDENYEHRCKYCHAAFKTKADKHKHEETHLDQEMPYKCSDCPETFATNKRRRIHMRSHGGPPKYKCKFCGIVFYRPLSLRRHLPVHTGEKPFKCSVCQRGFNQASHLKSHMRLHTGERPYKCKHCDKCFNHNVSLKSHVQRYHTSNSGRGQKKVKKSKTVTDTVAAQENGNKRGADAELDNVDKENDKEKVQKKKKREPKGQKMSTGRPVGRPKRNASGSSALAGQEESQGSNTKTAQVKVRRLKRKRCSDKESEDELTRSDASFDSAEEKEERSDKVTLRKGKSKRRGNSSNSDSDFDPEDSMEKSSSQNSPMGSTRRSARPRKKKVVEDA